MSRAARQIDAQSTITCPECPRQSTQDMPTGDCQNFWECPNCGEIIIPQKLKLHNEALSSSGA